MRASRKWVDQYRQLMALRPILGVEHCKATSKYVNPMRSEASVGVWLLPRQCSQWNTRPSYQGFRLATWSITVLVKFGYGNHSWLAQVHHLFKEPQVGKKHSFSRGNSSCFIRNGKGTCPHMIEMGTCDASWIALERQCIDSYEARGLWGMFDTRENG